MIFSLRTVAPVAMLSLFTLACGRSTGAVENTGAANNTEAPKDPMAEIAPSSVYALSSKALSGTDAPLSQYAGQVTVFVNVASECGYTKQYAGLQELHEALKGSGVSIVGVPSNDFGGQEPGSAEQIAAFCTENYGVTFDMLEKQGTKPGNSTLFDRLADLSGERPGWNFCKYVVSKDGSEARFFESGVKPGSDELRAVIDGYLAQ